VLPCQHQVPLPRRAEESQRKLGEQDLPLHHRLRQVRHDLLNACRTDRHGRDTQMSSTRLARREATDPAVPLLLFGALGLLYGWLAWPGALWLVMGGIAGYSLSGSV
jgi:hypothetical protein